MLTSPDGAADCASSAVSVSAALSAGAVPVSCTFALEVSAALSAPLLPHAAMFIAIAAVKDKASNFFAFNFLILLIMNTFSI